MTDVLKSVSRSFYLSLRFVPSSMRPALSVGYLLCRAADSIADTEAVPSTERLQLLNQLNRLMLSFPFDKRATVGFVEQLQAVVTTSASPEGHLLHQLDQIFILLESLSNTDQALVQEIVISVIQGMKMDLDIFGEPSDSLRALPSKKILETYVGWIGGEPGRFWTKIMLDHEPTLKIDQPIQWREKGFQFGTGLQMVNILRDLPGDLKLGRCYIPIDLLAQHHLKPADLLEKEAHVRFLPLYHQLIQDASQRLQKGIEYLNEIPPSYFRLRATVWWPLALGMKTLKLLRNRYAVLESSKSRKVSRWEVWMLLGSSPLVLATQRGMNRRFKRMTRDVS